MANLEYISPLDLGNELSPIEARIASNDEQIRLLRIDVAKILATPPTPPVPPSGDDITVGPGDNLQEAIRDANGKQILLKDGIYKPITLVANTRIRAINPGEAIIQGTKPWSDGWEKRGQAWYKPFNTPLYQHPASNVHGGSTPSERGLMHRKAMQPHLLVWNGAPMQPVYNTTALISGVFYLEGSSANPVGIWAKFPGEASPTAGEVLVGTSQHLAKTETEDVDGVELDGISFRYCANTGVYGAIHLPPKADYWTIKNCTVENTMSEGIRLRGGNHVVEDCKFNRNGHVGIALEGLFQSRLISCEASHNVWRWGVDSLWHAGGLKGQYGVNDNAIINYKATGNGGAGLWLDISNRRNVVDSFLIEGNKTFGIHIEHHTQDGLVQNGLIRGTRKTFDGKYWVGSGLQVQGAVTGYAFRNIDIENNSEGGVYVKKEGDGRGNSGLNIYDNLKLTGNGNDNRWAVQGDMAKMPDEYINMLPINFTNW